MKRCPECRRDYYDDTLLYCLDDGSALLEGPASMDEPATAILSESPVSAGSDFAESATRPQINSSTSDNTEPSVHSNDSPEKKGFFTTRAARPLVASVIVIALLVGGFVAFRYVGPGSSKQIDSIAVMPFINESGNADVEYLADGLTESLINSLSNLPNLSVKARNSVFRYKGTDIDERRVGRELSIQAMVLGRLTQRGNDLTLHLSLVDAQTGISLWGEQYNRTLSDLVRLQTELARDVSQKLRTRL